MNSRSTQTSKRTATAWVVALTAIGSLMAALDTLVVSTSLSSQTPDPAHVPDTIQVEPLTSPGRAMDLDRPTYPYSQSGSSAANHSLDHQGELNGHSQDERFGRAGLDITFPAADRAPTTE
jgi:hypothetical protein